MHDKSLCPRVEAAFNIIAKKWNGLVVRVLLDGAKRFSEISVLIPELSDRVLTDRLKELEADGIVKRIVYPETPVKVEYSLTEKGMGLKPVLEAIGAWAASWD